MPVVRALIESARGFERCSGLHVRELGLTPAQFDIVATLGNTEGMTCKELGQKTLITKGTLTGVLDRLADKGLLERTASPDDGRSWITRLTPFAVHVWFYRYILGDKRPRNELDQFPTHFRAEVAPAQILARARSAGLVIEYCDLYEGPVQTHLRQRSVLANLAFSAVGALSMLLTLGHYNANHSDCMIVLRKPAAGAAQCAATA